jgi:hypothetical protein
MGMGVSPQTRPYFFEFYIFFEIKLIRIQIFISIKLFVHNSNLKKPYLTKMRIRLILLTLLMSVRVQLNSHLSRLGTVPSVPFLVISMR